MKVFSYYDLYSDLMNFWNEKIPGYIYEANYENIVKNQEDESKKMIKFCDLSWEENCLFPEKNERSVSTASLSQVRSPIYKSSIKNWEKFSDKLGSLKRILQKKLYPNSSFSVV